MTNTVNPAEERFAAVHRVLGHYLRTAHTAALLLQSHRDPITPCAVEPEAIPERIADETRARAWFAAEHPVLVAAIRQAAATGLDTYAWQLAWALVGFFERRGLWRDQVAAQRVALEAAGRSADVAGQANAHRDLGGAYARLGLLNDASPHLRCALELFGAVGDRTGQARTHLRMAWVCYRLDNHEEAFRHNHQALDLYRATGDRAGQGRALNNIGWMHALVGHHEQAITRCRQALTLHQEVGNRAGLADAWAY